MYLRVITVWPFSNELHHHERQTERAWITHNVGSGGSKGQNQGTHSINFVSHQGVGTKENKHAKEK